MFVYGFHSFVCRISHHSRRNVSKYATLIIPTHFAWLTNDALERNAARIPKMHFAYHSTASEFHSSIARILVITNKRHSQSVNRQRFGIIQDLGNTWLYFFLFDAGHEKPGTKQVPILLRWMDSNFDFLCRFRDWLDYGWFESTFNFLCDPRTNSGNLYVLECNSALAGANCCDFRIASNGSCRETCCFLFDMEMR